MIEVQPMNGVVARRISGLDIGLPVVCKAGIHDGEMFAIGGLAFSAGRTWLWFHVEPNAPKNIIRMVLKNAELMLRIAVQLGATEVYTPREPSYATSERLCRLVGFEKTDEVVEGREIYIWRT